MKTLLKFTIPCLALILALAPVLDAANEVYNDDELNGTYTIEEVEVKPVPIEQNPPRVKAADLPAHSRVVLAMVIDELGDICSVRCLKSVNESIDEQVIRSVKRWKFKSAQHLGKPVSVRLVIPIRLNV